MYSNPPSKLELTPWKIHGSGSLDVNKSNYYALGVVIIAARNNIFTLYGKEATFGS